MKFIAFSVRDEERLYFEQWGKENNIEVTIVSGPVTEENIDLISGHQAVIGLQMQPYPNALFEKMQAEGMKVLAIRNVGFDTIDLGFAKKCGVKVTNVPTYSPNAIAEFAITQLMQLLRNTTSFNQRMAQNDYTWLGLIGKELRMMTVGVIGAGNIGQVFMQICQGFGAKVIAFDNSRKNDPDDTYVASLDELYQQADVISLHIPANKHTHHIINEESINKMKDGVYIINTARGALIDTKDLMAALQSGKVAGAALDTYEFETPIFNHNLSGQEINDPMFNELVNMSNVLVTPHVAFYTETAVENMVKIALASAKSVIETGTAPTLVEI